MTRVGDFLSVVASDLHEEDNSFGSQIWKPDEMIGYVNHSEKAFLRETGIYIDDIPLAVAAGSVILFDKPDGVMDIERMSFNGRRLRRQTTWDLERENPNWRANLPGPPRYWHEDHLPVNEFEIDRRPLAGGSFRLFVSKVPAEHLPHPDGYLEDMIVSDTWIQYIRWMVLALALSRDGDGQDIARSQYAYKRYSLGVKLASRLIIGGLETMAE